jgi:hypothetical protein
MTIELKAPPAEDEIKPRFSWKYIVLVTMVALIPSSISGFIGYGFNDYMRDRKLIEVSSRSSGNLASIPVSVGGNLEILFPITAARKEIIKSLVRYDVVLTNRTGQGLDDFSVFVEPPKGIELAPNPTVTTVPPELRGAISVKSSITQSGSPQLTISLLNSSQSINIGYLGFSQTEVISGTVSLTNQFIS